MPLARSRSLRTARGLLLACHPLPCSAVTVFAGAWTAVNGLGAARTAGVCGAVLLGQLSIGWGNDAVDAPRDRRAGRRDKPIPSGAVSRRVVAAAAVLAVLGCVVASLALGPRSAVAHLVAVAAAWAYNLGVKSTLASPLPYAVAFGLLPTVAVPATRPAVNVAAALLGVAAHFANTIGDTAADAATGVRGLPQRLGPDRSLRLAALALAAAAGALPVLAPAGGVSTSGVVLALSGVALSTAVALAGPRLGRRAFPLTLAAVALVVAALLGSR